MCWQKRGLMCNLLSSAVELANEYAKLALAEIHKVVPAILRTFTVEMAHDRPWKTHNASFIVQTDVVCRLRRRNRM